MPTNRSHAAREAGFSLLEVLVAAAVTIIVCGVAAALVAQTRRASQEGAPVVEQNDARAAVLAEMVTTIQDAASKMQYTDTRAALATITRSGGGGTSGPPAGYCLVIASDPSSWPPGFDPRDRSTWSQVDWWSGVDPNDPSTWYYNCGGKGSSGGAIKNGAVATGDTGSGGGKDPSAGDGSGGGTTGSVPHEFSLTPVVSYGSGFVVGGAITIAGPCAIVPEGSDPKAQQRGPGLMVARTDPNFDTFTLSRPFSSDSGVIRLSARDAAGQAEIARLVPGDVLVVTGRAGTGATVTALASLAEPFHEVSSPSVGGGSGEALFHDFEARIDPADATYLDYLANSSAARDGVRIDPDATVALLARDGAVVTYFATETERGLALRRVVGNPREPVFAETLVTDLAGPLEIAMLPEAASTGPAAGGPGGIGAAVTGVRIALPISSHRDTLEAEPVAASVALLDAEPARNGLRLAWDVLDETVSGGGGK